MKKTMLAGVVAASISALTLVGCNTSPSQTTEAVAPAVVETAVNDITRDYLLATDRLNTVDGSALEAQSADAVQALKQQMENAEDGTTITIPAGKYADLDIVTVKANDITIKAEQPGSVWLTGLAQLRLEGNNNTLQNSTFYYFNHAYEYQPDERRSEYPKYLWVSLWGKDGKVINNRFEGKQKRGTLIGVQKDDTPDNHLIANNIFLDQKPNQFNEFDIKEAIRYNGNSWEAIRIGDSKSSQWASNSKFTNNLMIDMDGERELISIKSGGNEISGNTIFESASLISLRHGKANVVKDNVILGNEKLLTGGMRIYDEDHVIENNYITGTRGRDGKIEGNADLRGGIVINTGIIDVANGEKLDQAVKGKELNKQWTPKNITIRNNTLVDTEWGIVYGNQTHRVSLFNNSEVKNIFAGVDVHFDSNVVDNHQQEQFVSVRATEELPLVNPTYNNEVYVGTVTNAEQIASYSVELPKSEQVKGFTQYQGVGADTSKLSVVTAETAGPDYLLSNAQK